MEKVRCASSHGQRHMGECLTFHDTSAERSANGFHSARIWRTSLAAVRQMCWALCFAVVLFGGLQLNLRCTLAQDQGLFPTRTVKIVTAAAPGGNPDLLARLLSQKLLERFGKPFVIESVPGAAGTLAARSVSAAPPDGYTLTIIDVPGLSVSAALNQSLGTSPGADLTPVASLVSVPTILVVRPELPVRSLKDFVELARARPKELTFGSGGVGSVHHLTMEIFASRSGIELLHVPYRGGSAMVNGLLTGEIQSGWAGIPSVASLIEDGRLRALCISIASRSASLPEIPTCSEAGYSGFEVASNLGLFGPPALPRSISSVLEESFIGAIADPNVTLQIRKMGMEVMPAKANQYVSYLASEAVRYQTILRMLSERGAAK
jgi:tripartite-type tricarboxylate transporter receptor subunit TctC